MTVRYKSATVDEFIENHSHDISKGGIFIKTRSPFPAGTLLKFEVRIAEDQKLMQGVGRVVWRREADRAEESFPAGMGIKFIKTGEGAVELINQLVAARAGAESSFDAGVRESNGAVSRGGSSAKVGSSLPPAAVTLERSSVATSPPASAPALQVDSDPRGLPSGDAERRVTAPAKKRQGLSAEKRKVVLQGPALEAPPSSKPKPVVRSASAGPEESAPSRAHSARRGSMIDETTSPRARAAKSKAAGTNSPSAYGLLAILGIVALVVFFVNRGRDDEAPEPAAAPEAPPAAITPTPEVPPAAAQPVAPAQAPVAPSAEAVAEGDPAAAPVAPNGANGVVEPAVPPVPPPAPPASAVPSAPAPPVAAQPPAAVAPSRLQPVPKPRPVPVVAPKAPKPAPPPAPAEGTRGAAGEGQKPAQAVPAPTAPVDAPAAEGNAPQPAPKKPAPPTAEAAPKKDPPPAPSAPPPAPPASDDNPY